MYNDFNSLFDNFFDVFNSTNSTRIPPVDVTEDPEGYSIDVEVPGYDKNDVDLKIENHSITIKTSDEFNKKVENDKSEYDYLINETHLNRIFKRSFSLPKDIDEAQIKAQFANGVLGIRIPKSKKVLAKTIEITEK
jgi:HSP20 family protein